MNKILGIFKRKIAKIKKLEKIITDKIFDAYWECFLREEQEKDSQRNIPEVIYRDEAYFNKYFRCQEAMEISSKNKTIAINQKRREHLAKINKLNLQLIKN